MILINKFTITIDGGSNREYYFLQEGDMPLEELLALYGYGGQQEQENDEAFEQASDAADDTNSTPEEDAKPVQEPSTLHQLYDKMPSETDQEPDGARLLRC